MEETKSQFGLSLIQIPGCILIAAVNILFSWNMVAKFEVDPRALVVVMLVTTLPSMICAWFLPGVLSSFFARQSLPEAIYPDARSLYSLCATALAGVVLSELVLSLLIGGWHVALLAWAAPTLVVFLRSAHRPQQSE